MVHSLKWYTLLLLMVNCHEPKKEAPITHEVPVPEKKDPYYKSIGEIPLPDGYTRTPFDTSSFTAWLRTIGLKKDKTVYLYNGLPKGNQSAQFAVLDISVANENLQQCADAVMRLRAEYLFAQKRFNEICFTDDRNRKYQWEGGKNRELFDSYLRQVFAECNSASLETQLKPVKNIYEMKAGDVFIKGGYPGHAVMVVDMAENKPGDKIFLLAQSYQPAQDIHILVNPMNISLSPWYKLKDYDTLYTPQWTFYKGQLRNW